MITAIETMDMCLFRNMDECMANIREKTGCSKVRADPCFFSNKNFWGGHGMVEVQTQGSAAYALKHFEKKAPVCFMGDGAANRGPFMNP